MDFGAACEVFLWSSKNIVMHQLTCVDTPQTGADIRI